MLYILLLLKRVSHSPKHMSLRQTGCLRHLPGSGRFDIGSRDTRNLLEPQLEARPASPGWGTHGLRDTYVQVLDHPVSNGPFPRIRPIKQQIAVSQISRDMSLRTGQLQIKPQQSSLASRSVIRPPSVIGRGGTGGTMILFVSQACPHFACNASGNLVLPTNSYQILLINTILTGGRQRSQLQLFLSSTPAGITYHLSQEDLVC